MIPTLNVGILCSSAGEFSGMLDLREMGLFYAKGHVSKEVQLHLFLVKSLLDT